MISLHHLKIAIVNYLVLHIWKHHSKKFYNHSLFLIYPEILFKS